MSEEHYDVAEDISYIYCVHWHRGSNHVGTQVPFIDLLRVNAFTYLAAYNAR